MTRLMIASAMFLLINGFRISVTVAEDTARATKQSVLVGASWLKDDADASRVRIIELGQEISHYREGHIPEAQFVHWVDDITDPTDQAKYTVAPPTMIQALLRRLGIRNDTTVVLYDDLNSRVSARFFWTLRYYGHKDIRILNGGRSAWRAAGYEFVTDATAVEPSTYEIAATVKKHRIRIKRIRNQLGKTGISIIDGRPPTQYTGEEPGEVYHTGKAHDQLGHIPGAINILWKDNFREDGTFKSPAELRKLYEEKGVTKDRKVITYCNEGLHAAPPWFVLTELLSYEEVRLYDESMAEWANNSDLPIRTGDQP